MPNSDAALATLRDSAHRKQHPRVARNPSTFLKFVDCVTYIMKDDHDEREP